MIKPLSLPSFESQDLADSLVSDSNNHLLNQLDTQFLEQRLALCLVAFILLCSLIAGFIALIILAH